MDSPLEANRLGEKALASLRKNKFQEVKNLGIIFCDENHNYVEMVEDFWLVVSVSAIYKKHVSICWLFYDG